MKDFCRYGYPTFEREYKQKKLNIRKDCSNIYMWNALINLNIEDSIQFYKFRHFHYFISAVLPFISKLTNLEGKEYRRFYMIYDHLNQFGFIDYDFYYKPEIFDNEPRISIGRSPSSWGRYDLYQESYEKEILNLTNYESRDFKYPDFQNSRNLPKTLLLGLPLYFYLKSNKIISLTISFEKPSDNIFKCDLVDQYTENYKIKYRDYILAIRDTYKLFKPYCKEETEAYMDEALIRTTRTFNKIFKRFEEEQGTTK